MEETIMTTQSDSGKAEDFDNIDIHEPNFVLDPYPTYEHLRAECPVVHSEHYGGFWLLTRYEDVRSAALDWQTYTSSVAGVTAIPIITPRTEPMLPIELDPPRHSRYRALMSPVFAKQRIAVMQPRIEAIAGRLVDRLLAQGGGDLVADYAAPLTVETLAEFTNLPKADAPRWVAWIQRMFDVTQPEDSARASAEMGSYIDELIAERRRTPGDDFISLLMESTVERQQLTDKEIHSFCTVVFGAGFETTADAISVSLYYLAEHPDDQRRLAAQPELVPTALEEFLRYVSPVQIFGRNAAHDVEVHGRTIGQGDVMALAFGSANHDPTLFPEPERCILDRAPNRHLTFGAGVHLCLGAPVARMEMEVTLQEFAGRVPSFKLAPGEGITWKKRGDRRGLARLPVVIDRTTN
jgi:cytochrome P450